MKNSRMKITAVLLTAAFTLTGCGEALYVLEPEEEAAIVSYAAHTVSKFNIHQQDGEVYVMQSALNGEEEQDTQEMAEEVPSPEAETETELQKAEDPSAAAENAEQSAGLTQALDLGVVQADYVGAELCTTYEKSDIYAVDAQPGSQLLVMKVNLKNTIDQKLHIDILAMTPSFRASVNGGDLVAAQTTILPNDLSTYQSDLEAGGSAETVLLFQIPENIQEISDIQMKITMNGNNYTVNL